MTAHDHDGDALHPAFAPHDERVSPDAPTSALDSTGFLSEIPLPLEEPVPTRIGGYRVLRIIGQGGMGTVYEAEQESTRRFVAVKVIHPHLTTARYRRRFAEEIRTLGRFEHPGIARIHEAGSAPDDQGALRLYFAMELVQGLRVDEHTTSHALGSIAIASLMAGICDAVHHAHQKGVIHCDLKPANILVATDGTPKILDFGIARIMGDEIREASAVSNPGDHAAIIGTLAFASPEQAAGDRNRLDVLTDVYGLGAVLYALLTGRPPHDVKGRSLPEAARIVRDVSPARVRALRPRCPADLETIVAKATAPVSSDRYDSAAALAVELRHFVEGRPIQARPAPWYEVAAKLVRRNRLASTACAITIVALATGGISLGVALAQRDAEARRVIAERRDHDGTRSAIQGSLLTPDSRHRRSSVFNGHLAADEASAYRGRVLALLPWSATMLAGAAPGQLQALDDQGDVVDSLDTPRAWPSWVHPRFDLAKRFEQFVDKPQATETLVVAIGNCDKDAARELVRGMSFQNEHLHMAVLEVDEVSAVIETRGAPTQSTTQLWSHGDFLHVVLDESRRLIWSLSVAEELPIHIPELAAWDSARCPGGSDGPRVLFAIDVSELQGKSRVLPPLIGDTSHPPIQPRWAFSTRPPKSMRGSEYPSSRASVPSGASELQRGVTRLQIQSFEPIPARDGKGLGRLFIAFRKADIARDAIVSVEIDEYGNTRGPFRPELIHDPATDQRALEFAAQFDPAEEVVRLDLDSLGTASPLAELALRDDGDLASALASITTNRHVTRAERIAIERGITARTSNWRWLNNSAAELMERPEVISGLGTAPNGQIALDCALALARIEEADVIHSGRCPDHGAGTCVCEWFIEHERALALCAAGEWAECVQSASRAIALHDAQPMLGDENPSDYAILAIAQFSLGLQVEADSALDRAEQETLDLSARNQKSHQGSVDELRPRLLAQARALIRGR